eukprot:scaffold160_cov136-Cylindrotheca_fusiformis.AAC.12
MGNVQWNRIGQSSSKLANRTNIAAKSESISQFSPSHLFSFIRNFHKTEIAAMFRGMSNMDQDKLRSQSEFLSPCTQQDINYAAPQKQGITCPMRVDRLYRYMVRDGRLTDITPVQPRSHVGLSHMYARVHWLTNRQNMGFQHTSVKGTSIIQLQHTTS